MSEYDIIQEIEEMWQEYESGKDKRKTQKSTLSKIIKRLIEIHNDYPEHKKLCRELLATEITYSNKSSMVFWW